MTLEDKVRSIQHRMQGISEEEILDAIAEDSEHDLETWEDTQRGLKLIKCFCCKQEDTVTPCRDCISFCLDNAPCKAKGITKLRINIADKIHWVAHIIYPR